MWHFRIPGLITKVNEEMTKGRTEELTSMPEGVWESNLLTESLRTQLYRAGRERLPGTEDRKKKWPPNIKHGVFWELQIVQ